MVGKVMTSVFTDAADIFMIDCLKKGTAINGIMYYSYKLRSLRGNHQIKTPREIESW